tara:strand:+ start:1529 stop:1888 length:360 start_codon:yes stop_codon:yes gene_type:complete
MFNAQNILALTPGQNLFSIIITGVLFISLLLFFINIKRSSFKASDGKGFKSEEQLKKYEELLGKINQLFDPLVYSKNTDESYGLKPSFLDLLKNKGFNTPQLLIDSKQEFKKLSDLLNN